MKKLRDAIMTFLRSPEGNGWIGILLFSADGSGLLLVPALTIDRAVAEKGLDILQRCA